MGATNRLNRMQISMNDFRIGGFKISVDKEEKEVIKPKPKPKGLFSTRPKKTMETKEIKKAAPSKSVKSKEKSTPMKQAKAKIEVKEKPKSVYKSRSALKKQSVVKETKVQEPKVPSFKLPSLSASLPKSTPKPDPVPTPVITEGAYVRPQSTYSARIASYFVFVIFLYFFINF